MARICYELLRLATSIGAEKLALILPVAALSSALLLARPSLCALLSALRGTSGGASMTIPGGAGTLLWTACTVPRAGRTGFSRGVGALAPYTRLRPLALPRSYGAGCFSYVRGEPSNFVHIQNRLRGQSTEKSSRSPGRKGDHREVCISFPGPERRHERARGCFGAAALACKGG